MDKKKNYVVVTTEFRGVFFGAVKDNSKLPEEITLTEVRNCISWSSSIGGFVGLFSKGPDANCRIGTETAELTLYKVTSCGPVSEEAVAKWKKA